jgi:hypothetical protein
VIYLTPNNGSDASPIGNVENNEVKVDLAGKSDTVAFSLPVTSPFTATSGGILAVFAKDQDGTVFTSKSNSLNCTESTPTPTPTAEPTPTPTAEPTATPTAEPTATPEPVVTPTPTTPANAPTPPAPTPTTPANAPTPPAPTPTASIEAVTGTPRITPPPTDSAGGGSSSGSGWGIAMLALGGLAALALVATPVRKRTRR